MDTTKSDPQAAFTPLQDLPGAAEAVFQRPAVLVGAVVHEGHGELIQQVAPVHGVDLDAGKAALLQKGRRGHHLVDLLADLVPGEGGGQPGRVVVIGDLRGDRSTPGRCGRSPWTPGGSILAP